MMILKLLKLRLTIAERNFVKLTTDKQIKIRYVTIYLLP